MAESFSYEDAGAAPAGGDGFSYEDAIAPTQPQQGNFSRGVETSLRQLPQTAGGALALVGDAVGSEGLKKYGLGVYRGQQEQIEKISKPSDSFSNVLEGNASVGDFLPYAAGYVGGQAATALGTGGLGAFVGRRLVQRGIAKGIGDEAARLAARRGAEIGGGAALGASNYVQEAGSIYPEAVQQAQQEGRTLDGGDLARVAGSAAAAAGLETLADILMLRGVTRGVSGSPSIVRRAATAIPAAAAREAGTEAVQTGIERFGAQQSLTDEAAVRDYIDSSALGAVGGGLGGAAGAVRQHEAAPPPAGPLEEAARLALPAPVVHADAQGRAKMDGVPSGGFDTGTQQGRRSEAQPPQVAPLQLRGPQIDVDAAGNARAPGQIPAVEPGEPGPRETGAFGLGRNSEEVGQRRLPPPTVNVDSSGVARAPGQNVPPASPPREPGPLETGAAIAQGRNSETVFPRPAAQPQALPAPDITVDARGAAATVPQREGARRAQEQAAQAERTRRQELGLPQLTREGDILAEDGRPFRNGVAAARAAKRAGAGFRPVRVNDREFVVRRDTSDVIDVPAREVSASAQVPREAPARTVASVTGPALDSRWTGFSQQSGTKGVPRAQMPQIKTEHRGPLVNFLGARGITHESVEVPAGDLMPTQAEFSPKKVQQARDFKGGDRSILISADNHILDGHHQWLAKLDTNEPVKAIRLKARIDKLVSVARDFPSADVAAPVTAASGMQPEGTSNTGNGLAPDAHLSADRTQAHAGATQRLHALGVDGQKMVQRRVLAVLHDRQVLKSVIERVPVDVVNGLVGTKHTPESLLRDPAVLLDRLSSTLDDPVVAPGVVRFLDAVLASHPASFTGLGAEEKTTLASGKAPSVDREGSTAGVTRDRSSHSGNSTEGIPTARGESTAAAVAQTKPAQGETKPGKSETKGLRVGTTPGDAEPVTVRDGVIYIGKYAAANFETGEEVRVPKGANPLQIRKALQDAGVLTRRQRFFGIGEAVATAPAAQQNAIGTPETQNPAAENGSEAGPNSTAAAAPVAPEPGIEPAAPQPEEAEPQRQEVPPDGGGTESKPLAAGTTLYHGTRGEFRLRDGLLYLTTDKAEAGAFAAGLIPGTGRGAKGKANTVALTLKGEARVLDVNAAVNAALEDGDVDEVIAAAAARARAAGYEFLRFDHPSLTTGGEFTAYVALDPVGSLQTGELRAPAAQEEVQPAKPGAVGNFGEQLPEARRNRNRGLGDQVKDSEWLSEPFSKLWPADEHEQYEDPFIGALVFAARAEVPARPRVAYKAKAWVEKVKALRELGGLAVANNLSRDDLVQRMQRVRGLDQFANKVRLLEQLPRAAWKRIGKVAFYPEALRYLPDGGKEAKPYGFVEVDGKALTYEGADFDGLVRRAQASVDAQVPATQKLKFEIRGPARKTGRFIIVKEGDAERRPLREFDDLPAARRFLADNHADLVAAWEGVKGRDNVKEKDLRREVNRPRTGQDWRKGKDATPQQFQQQFGFRGGEFGSWVTQGAGAKERQGLLNQAYDALSDLAYLLDIPSRAISLNGTLGIAFGARGHGWASAHFEPDTLVINLTKTRGAGAIGHEWFHALDNYFARMRNDGEAKLPPVGPGFPEAYRRENFITYKPEPMLVHKDRTRLRLSRGKLEQMREQQPDNPTFDPSNWQPDPAHPQGVRTEVEERWAELVRALNASPMAKRAELIDKGKSGDGYWSQIIERGARSFENYILAKMQAQGFENDYLSNVRTLSEFPRDPGRYPYLLPDEVGPIAEAFDNLFGSLQTRQTPKGVALFSRSGSAAPTTAQKAAVLQGEPVIDLATKQAPRGFAALRQWATKLFTDAGGKATNPELGDVVLNHHSVRDSLAHGMSQFKAEAFAAVPAVIERGVVVHRAPGPDFESIFISAPVRIQGVDDIVTVLVRRDPNTQRMYLHSVATKESLLGPGVSWTTGANPQRPRSSTSGDVASVLRELLTFNLSEDGGGQPGGRPSLRRGGAEADPFARERVGMIQEAVQRYAAGWKVKPGIHVIATMQDAPSEVLRELGAQNSQGASGEADGFFWDGGVYLVASNIRDAAHAQQVLFHEALGHFGLRRVFGDSLVPILRQLATMRPQLIARKAQQYGLDLTKEEDRLMAAEEVLAELAQERPQIGWVQRTIAAIRRWLRAHGVNVGLSDKDILASYILPARGFVERGRGGKRAAARPALSRGMGNMDRLQEAYERFDDGESTERDLLAEVQFLAQDGGVSASVQEAAERYQTEIEENETEFAGRGNEYEAEEAFVAAVEQALQGAIPHAELRERGEQVASKMDAERRMSDGERIFAQHEQDEGLHELHSVTELNGYTADQLIVLPPRAAFSRSTMVGRARDYTPAQERAMRNVGFEVQEPTLIERARALWQDAGKKLAQGIADQFRPVKDLDAKAYNLLRLSKGASGAFETLLRGGMLKLSDGVYDFDEAHRGGVVDKLLIPLQGEHHDFFRWIAANRAERLAAEGKENLFSAEDIAALKTLASGELAFDYKLQHGPRAGQVTRSRAEAYADSLKTFNAFNRNVLDLAQQSGLIDGESRHLWEHEFYVPFYRVAEETEGGLRGATIKSGVVRQEAFKKLKGGREKLNADLLDNTLLNWAHLLDAAAKNRAAKATLEAAERVGAAIGSNEHVARQIGRATGNRGGVVWFMDGGTERYFVVEDPFLLTALTSLEYAGMRNPVMNAMGTFKHVLTVGVTASPFFKVRNLIRDSVQAIASGPLSFNPAANLAEGWKATNPKADEYFRLLAGGGTIHFGTMLEGSEAKRVQALVESGVDRATILDTKDRVQAFYRKVIEPAITAYNELGNRGEAVNRAALYQQLRRQGKSHAEASLEARDLMDFSLQGSFTTVRFLTQVVPFMNARIQGLYKLGRAAKEDPARFAAVLGTTALVSLALLAAYGDDDDWKKREEWDRNNFWWFKFGGTAFRIPKPFEIGAIATLAERGFELAFDNEMTGNRFRQQVLQLLGDNLSMNPIPQLVKPVLDVYSNKDSFTGRPIETIGMSRLKSEFRFTDRTSMVARGISTTLNAGASLLGAEALSPVQVDHMLRGYFGWLGSFVVGAADTLARPATGQPTHPAPDYWKTLTGSMVSDLQDAPSRYVSQMYQQAQEIERAYGTWRMLLKEGKVEEASQFRQEHEGDLARAKMVDKVKRGEGFLNQRIRLIERDDTLTPEEKRDRIRVIRQQQDRLARLTAPG